MPYTKEQIQQYTGGDGYTPESISRAMDAAYSQGADSVTARYLENKDVGSLEYLQERARLGDASAIDRLYNYNLSEASANTAREWTAKREDTQYQRLVADLTKAGINPYFALSGGNPISSSSSGFGYNSSTATSQANNYNTNQTKLEVAKTQAAAKIFAAFITGASSVFKIFTGRIGISKK